MKTDMHSVPPREIGNSTDLYWDRSQAGVTYDQEFENIVGRYTHESETCPLRDIVGHLEGKQILDVGCGTARHLKLFKPGNQLHGIDQSKEMLEVAKQKVPQARFSVSFAEELPFESNRFDLVYSVRVMQHVRDQKRMIQEMARVCLPRGLVIVVNYNSWSLLNIYKHIRMSWAGRVVNLPFKVLLGRRSFFGPWGFHYDNYCSIPELAHLMENADLQVIRSWGVTCGMPWFFNNFFIGKILEILAPTFFSQFLKLCLWFDSHLARRFPLKYFTDLVLVAGEKK